MQTINKHIIVLLLCVASFASFAQIKQPGLLTNAAAAAAQLNYIKAVNYYKQFLSTEKKASLSLKEIAITGIADSYWKMRDYANASYWYDQLSPAALAASETALYRKAEMLARKGKYEDAASLLINLKRFNAKAASYKNPGTLKKDSADWKINYLDLNTKFFREFSPALINNSLVWSTNEPTAKRTNGVMAWDGKSYNRLVFFADQTKAKSILMPDEEVIDSALLDQYNPKFLVTHYSNADKSLLKNITLPTEVAIKRKREGSPEPLSGLGSLQYNIAHLSISAIDGKAYFSVNDQDASLNTRHVGIATAAFNATSLGAASFLPINSKNYSTMHPAIHPNGKTLVYASNQPGGKGGFDLYFIEKLNDSTWSAPTALTALNTEGNELFASFNAQGELFYSTDGLPGLGGLDIVQVNSFKSSDLYVLPAPINSGGDDFGITFNVEGKQGYFTSDRLGSDDLYRFVYQKVFVQLTGHVISRATDAPKQGVTVRLYKNTPAGRIFVETVTTDAQGNFTLNARPNNDYVIVIDNGDGDLQEQVVSTENTYTNKSAGTFYVDKKPEPIVIKDPEPIHFIIYFDFDKHKLKKESIKTLDDVVALLNTDSTLKVTLGAHTDLDGPDNYNEILSNKREANTVKYLQKAGIDASRITSDHFGERMPVELNRKWNDAWKNRRVEIIVGK